MKEMQVDTIAFPQGAKQHVDNIGPIFMVVKYISSENKILNVSSFSAL